MFLKGGLSYAILSPQPVGHRHYNQFSRLPFNFLSSIVIDHSMTIVSSIFVAKNDLLEVSSQELKKSFIFLFFCLVVSYCNELCEMLTSECVTSFHPVCVPVIIHFHARWCGHFQGPHRTDWTVAETRPTRSNTQTKIDQETVMITTEYVYEIVYEV